jgi:hypothetical protein
MFEVLLFIEKHCKFQFHNAPLLCVLLPYRPLLNEPPTLTLNLVIATFSLTLEKLPFSRHLIP